MDGSMKDLILYRFHVANEMLTASENALSHSDYRTSLNRSYYAIFHAMRAINALDSFDSSKHSGVISHFRKEYLKTDRLDRGLTDIITNASFYREKSDYDDFYIAGKAEAEQQLNGAKVFVSAVDAFLKTVEL